MSRAAAAAVVIRRPKGHCEVRSHLFNAFTAAMGMALLLSVAGKVEARGKRLAGVRTAVELLDKRHIRILGSASSRAAAALSMDDRLA